MNLKQWLVMGCLAIFWTACGTQSETVVNLRIPQTLPSDNWYEVNLEGTLLAASAKGSKTELPIKYAPGQRYEQVGGDLYVWNIMGFKGLDIYTNQGKHSTIPLETAGEVHFITNRSTGYMSGWFQNDKLFIDIFDPDGKKVSGDFFEFKRIADLYTGAKLFALHVQEEIWLWSPAHGKILIFNKEGIHKETFDADSVTMKRFDAIRVEDLWAAEESGDLTKLTKLVKEREGEVVKVEAMTFFLYRGVPTFGFNTGLLSPELQGNQFYVIREAVLEEVKGVGIYNHKNCELGGLSQNKIFLNDFSVPTVMEKILVN